MLVARSRIAISWRSHSESEEQDSTRLEEPCLKTQYYVLEGSNPPIYCEGSSNVQCTKLEELSSGTDLIKSQGPIPPSTPVPLVRLSV